MHCIALHDMTLHYIAVFRLDKAWDVWRNHHPEDHVGGVSILMSLLFLRLSWRLAPQIQRAKLFQMYGIVWIDMARYG